MEKMNQVSVSEFFAKSKEEMYDMAVEMVEKYNRLVDICNDSAERMADLIERHNVYTSALNKDIAAKAAKIELMQKEIDGRKAGYVALKTQMDRERESASYWKDKYIKLQEENDEIDKDSKTHYDMYKYGEELLKVKDAEIEKLKKELDARGEEIRKLNKCIMNKNESINTGNEAIINLRKEIGAHEEENARLSERIKNFRTEIAKERNENTLARDREEIYQEKIKELSSELTKWKDLANMNKDTICDQYEVCEEFKKKIAELEKENGDYAVRVDNLTKEIEKLKVDLIHEREKNEKLARAHAELENDMRKRCEDVISQSKTICNLKKELDICGHEVRFYKDRMNTLYEEKIEKEDDHGRAGFKKYIEWLVKEEETKFKESWKARLNEELEAIFKEKEETEVKGVGRTSSGRYPWGAKIIRCEKPDNFHCVYGYNCPVEAMEKCKFAKEWKSDIPCGEDAIE